MEKSAVSFSSRIPTDLIEPTCEFGGSTWVGKAISSPSDFIRRRVLYRLGWIEGVWIEGYVPN